MLLKIELCMQKFSKLMKSFSCLMNKFMTSLIPQQTEAARTEFKVEKQGPLFNLLLCSYQENTSCLMRFQNIDSLSNFIRRFLTFCSYLHLKLQADLHKTIFWTIVIDTCAVEHFWSLHRENSPGNSRRGFYYSSTDFIRWVFWSMELQDIPSVTHVLEILERRGREQVKWKSKQLLRCEFCGLSSKRWSSGDRPYPFCYWHSKWGRQRQAELHPVCPGLYLQTKYCFPCTAFCS